MKKLLTIAISPALIAPATYAATYQVDGSHSSASFTVRHMMVSNVTGAFNKVSGTVDYDPQNPSQARVDVTIEAASVNTRSEGRDKHLRSADFFDAENFPTITFKSKRVERLGESNLKVTGDLAIRSVSKEVVLDVDGPTPEILTQGTYRVGASASTKINRKDFGVSWSRAMDNGGVVVSDDVRISIDVELTRKPPAAVSE